MIDDADKTFDVLLIYSRSFLQYINVVSNVVEVISAIYHNEAL